MERRMLLAVVLSFLVVTLYSAMMGQCSPRKPGEGTETDATGPDGTTPEGVDPSPADPPPRGPDPRDPAPGPGPRDPVAGDPRGSEDGPPPDWEAGGEETVLESDELRVTLTSQGAGVRAITLRHAYELDRKTPLDLVVPEGPLFLLGQIDEQRLGPGDEADGGGAPGGKDRVDQPAGVLRWKVWRRAPEREAEMQAPNIVYELEHGGLVWSKRWWLTTGTERFDLNLRVGVRAAGPEAVDPDRRVKVLVTAGLLREPDSRAAFLYPNVALARLAPMSEPSATPHGTPLVEGRDARELRLLGAKTHYFLLAYYVDRDEEGAPEVVRFWGTGEAADRLEEIDENIVRFFETDRDRTPADDPALDHRIRDGVRQMLHNWLVIKTPALVEEQTVDLRFYAGPIDREVLGQEAYASVEPVIAYTSAWDPLAKGLLAIYDAFRNLLGSAGVAVILMTLVVRGLMMPLSIKNQLSMRVYSKKIAKLKPKIETLKQKFGNNPKRLREEQMKLYRENQIGFPMGCLMMLIQIPIFFALFSSLRQEYTLRNAGFLWIEDLGGPDRLIDLPFDIPLVVLTVFSINILPLLMVALSIYQQKQMPKPADEQQAQQMRMMKWMPIFFAVILYNYTAALALYMVFSSAVGIIESKIVRAKDPTRDDPGSTAPEPEPAPA